MKQALAGFETILLLLLGSAGLAVIGKRVAVPAPIMMVIGGLCVALAPGLPAVRIEPDLAFAIFVPPLLFRAALTTSLRGLRSNLRPVLLLAVGLVGASTVAVAAAAHFLLQQPWPTSFVLGAILSPPDAVVAISLARALRLPRRALSILEGETLLNDTTAFVLYRQALAAAVTGSFSLAKAVPQFVLVGAGGAAVGYVVYLVIRYARAHLKDPVLENVVWLLVPFFAFLPAEALHVSGVLSVVVAGVLLRQSSPLLVSARTRVQANLSFDLVEFMLNSLIFVLIGMEVGHILRDPSGPPLLELLRATAIVTLVLIAVRFAWMFPGAFLPHVLSERVRKTEKLPTVAGVTLLAWMGMRGGDSLVTALAVPHAIASGAPFPGRMLLVAVTFGVILATLLLQGLTLRPLMKVLRPPDDHAHEEEEKLARREMAKAGDERLTELHREGVPAHVVEKVRHHHKKRSSLEMKLADPEAAHADGDARHHQRAQQELLRARREAVVKLRNDDVIDDEVLRHLEQELDLEEMRLDLAAGDGAEPDDSL